MCVCRYTSLLPKLVVLGCITCLVLTYWSFGSEDAEYKKLCYFNELRTQLFWQSFDFSSLHSTTFKLNITIIIVIMICNLFILATLAVAAVSASPMSPESQAEREARLLAHLSCDKESRNALDQRALELVGLGDPNFRYPESEDELENYYCPRVMTASNCIRHYANNCLRPLPRQLVKLFVADNKTNSDACQSSLDIKRDRIIPMFRCLNKAISSIHSCASRSAHALNHINHHVAAADTEQRFAYTCREFYQLSCCYKQQVDLFCPADLAEIARVYWDRDTDATAKFLCRFYPPNSPAIETLPPLDLNHIHSESYGHRHEAQSILLGLIDLYNKASEEEAYKYRFTPIVSATN